MGGEKVYKRRWLFAVSFHRRSWELWGLCGLMLTKHQDFIDKTSRGMEAKRRQNPWTKTVSLATQRVYRRAESSLCWAQCGIQTWMNGSKHEHASHLQHGLPKNHPIEKENHLPSGSNFCFHDVPCVNFPLCSSPTEMGPLAAASGIISFLMPIYKLGGQVGFTEL